MLVDLAHVAGAHKVGQVFSACGRRETHVGALYRRGLERKDVVARALGVAVKIYGDVDGIGGNARCDVGHTPGAAVCKVLRLRLHRADAG